MHNAWVSEVRTARPLYLSYARLRKRRGCASSLPRLRRCLQLPETLLALRPARSPCPPWVSYSPCLWLACSAQWPPHVLLVSPSASLRLQASLNGLPSRLHMAELRDVQPRCSASHATATPPLQPVSALQCVLSAKIESCDSLQCADDLLLELDASMAHEVAVNH